MKLGAGEYGTAYLAEAQSNQEKVVIKQVRVEGMTREEVKQTVKEAKILQHMNHKNVVGFKEVYRTKNGFVCLVMEYCDDGDLDKKIEERL